MRSAERARAALRWARRWCGPVLAALLAASSAIVAAQTDPAQLTRTLAKMRELAARFRIDMAIVVAADHAASFAQLASGAVDAFATDDVLLYGLVAQNKVQADYVVSGDFLSYDPYGIMFRKGDAQLAALVEDTFRQLADDHE